MKWIRVATIVVGTLLIVSTSIPHAEEAKQDPSSYIGVGLKFEWLVLVAHVVEVVPGGPAMIAGIKVGDSLVSIDGVSAVTIVRARGLEGLSGLLRDGPEGSVVTLGIKRFQDKSFHDITITVSRARIQNH